MKATLIIVWMITGIGMNDGVDLQVEKIVGLNFGKCLELTDDLNNIQGYVGAPHDAKYSVRAYCVPHK